MTANAAPQVSQKPIEVTESQIACDGGGGALGHPRVYLTLAADGTVECPYCDQKFVLKAGASGGHGH